MKLQGKNLIISANGSVLAAAKSCTLNVDCEKIKVSSPTDGQWEHVIAGMKSWSLSTSHLLEGADYAHKVTAFAQANNGIRTPRPSFVQFGSNGKATLSSRGLCVVESYLSGDISSNAVDTYDNLALCSEVVSSIGESESQELAIISYDAFGMTSELREAIEDFLKVDMRGVPVGQYRGALVVIGNKDPESTTPGIMMFKKDNDGFGGSVHAELLIDNNNRPITATPLKNCVARVGQLFTISVQVDELGSDRLSGTALCNTFQVTAVKSNLMQGSFKFQGNGPLT
jgi:hypothetical protein